MREVEGGAGDGRSISGVPLHHDDPDLSNKAGPSVAKPSMIGKRVKVFWPVDESWYEGVVQQYDSSTGEHLLRYHDGDTEWVKIGEDNILDGDHGSVGGGPPLNGRPGPMAPVENEPKGGPPPVPGEPPPRPSAPGGPQGGVGPGEMFFGAGPGGFAGQGFPPPSYGMPPFGMPAQYGAAGPMFAPGGMYGNHSAYGGGQAPSLGPGPGLVDGKMDDGMASEPSSGRRKSGPKAWTKEEDALLLNIVHSMQWPMKWTIVAQSLPDRTGKQCRERYVNHLNPRLKVADWTPVEDATVFHLYNSIGSHWAKMAKVIPGRTDNGIKNRFHNIRRQYEREDEHRMRLSSPMDFPDEIRADRLRKFPSHLAGNSVELWNMQDAIGILAAQAVLGESAGRSSSNSNRFGPFRDPKTGEPCVRCGLLVPSVQTGKTICTKTGWCHACTRIPPHIAGNLLRECINLRREQDASHRPIIESWEEYFRPAAGEEPAFKSNESSRKDDGE